MICDSDCGKQEGDQSNFKSSTLKLLTSAMNGDIGVFRDRAGAFCVVTCTAGSSDWTGWAASGTGACSACVCAGVAETGAGLSMVVLVDRLSALLACGGFEAQLAVEGRAGRLGAGLLALSPLPCRAIACEADAIGCCDCGGGARPWPCCDELAFIEERSARE